MKLQGEVIVNLNNKSTFSIKIVTKREIDCKTGQNGFPYEMSSIIIRVQMLFINSSSEASPTFITGIVYAWRQAIKWTLILATVSKAVHVSGNESTKANVRNRIGTKVKSRKPVDFVEN